jgi:hypothetical protein
VPFKAPLKAYFDFVGGDGFMVSPTYSPGAIEEFVDLVVPGAATARAVSAGVRWANAARPSRSGSLTRFWP